MHWNVESLPKLQKKGSTSELDQLRPIKEAKKKIYAKTSFFSSN